MRRLSGYRASQYESFPRRVNSRGLRQQLRRCLRRRHTEAVLSNGTRRNNPQLNQILRDNVKLPSSNRQKTDRGIGRSIERMLRLKSADQNACVNKHALRAVWINALAADGLLRQERRRAIVTFRPLVESARPFLRVGLLQVRQGRTRRQLCSNLLQPALHR